MGEGYLPDVWLTANRYRADEQIRFLEFFNFRGELKVIASGAAGDFFGYSAALDDGTAVIGASGYDVGPI